MSYQFRDLWIKQLVNVTGTRNVSPNSVIHYFPWACSSLGAYPKQDEEHLNGYDSDEWHLFIANTHMTAFECRLLLNTSRADNSSTNLRRSRYARQVFGRAFALQAKMTDDIPFQPQTAICDFTADNSYTVLDERVPARQRSRALFPDVVHEYPAVALILLRIVNPPYQNSDFTYELYGSGPIPYDSCPDEYTKQS